MAEEPKPQFAEDEDLERAKAFWKENGRSIIAGIVLGVGGIGGYNGWQFWQQSQGENASQLFQNMQDENITMEAAKGLADDLVDDYGTTPYATHAALLMAKRAVEAGDFDEAVSRLSWAANNTDDPGLKSISTVRLAMAHLAAGNADQVLSVVTAAQNTDSNEFTSRYAELEGDAQVLKNDVEAARKAYKKSIQSMPEAAPSRVLVQLKLDNL